MVMHPLVQLEVATRRHVDIAVRADVIVAPVWPRLRESRRTRSSAEAPSPRRPPGVHEHGGLEPRSTPLLD